MLERLHAALAAVCPIDGVSIGRWADKSTWRVDFADVATPDERSAAAAVLAAFDPAAITSEAVNAERDRRLRQLPHGGRMYDFVDGKGSDLNIIGASALALAALEAGAQEGNLRWADPDRDFAWISADNAVVPMDAVQMLAFGRACAAYKARIVHAARRLKSMAPIPADYTADARW